VPHVIARGLVLAALAVAAVHGSAHAEGPGLSLEQALLLAAQSPEVQLALGHRHLAQRQRDAAAGLVTAELRTGYGHTWSNTETAGTGREGLQPITLSATFNVLPFGPAAENLQRNEWLLQEATIDLREAVAGAAVTAAERYLTALRAQQETALREAQVALTEGRLEAVRTRFEVGAANQGQLLEAELEVSSAQAELANALRQQVGALASLSVSLGVDVPAVAGEPPRAALPTDVAAEVTLGETASVLVAEIRVLQAELGYHTRLRDFLPSGAVSFDIATSSGWQSLRVGASLDTRAFQPGISLAYDPSPAAASLPGGSATSTTISLTARIPLDASMPAALDAAHLNVEGSRMRAALARDLAALEVSNRRRQWEAAVASEALSREVLDARRASLRATRERVALGIATELDSRHAELTVQSAELALLRNQDAALVALMRLMQSLALDPTEVF
jgi:outer membrane protein TolC